LRILQVVEIDGSFGEGGGQILRTTLSLAAIYGRSVKITKIRAKRKDPGLRPQHVQSVLSAAKISGGEIKGANIGSTEIEFSPGKLPESFTGIIETGTAGSVTLIAQTIIPISIFGKVDLDLEIRGGTEVPHSPTVDYLVRLVKPIYEKLGARLEINLKQRGYYPRGGGSIALKCSPSSFDLEPIEFSTQDVRGNHTCNILSVSRLLPRHVADRQATSARAALSHHRYRAVKTEFDPEGDSLSPGSSILVYERGDAVFIGSSSLGERGKKAEIVGEEAGRNFLKEIQYSPNVDSHLADMLVTLLSCIPGRSDFNTSFLTDHFSTNCEITKKLTGCNISTKKFGELWHVEIVGSPEKPN
jgi:RNA 3'-phosphate cyclase